MILPALQHQTLQIRSHRLFTTFCAHFVLKTDKKSSVTDDF